MKIKEIVRCVHTKSTLFSSKYTSKNKIFVLMKLHVQGTTCFGTKEVRGYKTLHR